jgi:Kef-type K+ transport system membrane component KefB
MESVFAELSSVIAVTLVVSIIMKLIKQPLILGYIIAGLIVGPTALHLIHSTDLFESFSQLGIALLLFIIGLGIRIDEFRKLGKVVILASIANLLIITLLGFATASIIGFTKTESLIMGLALYFSSTIIIIKILTDKREQNRLHGQIAIGIILIEDLVATLALLFIVAAKDGGGLDVSQLFFLGAKAIILLLFLFFCSRKLLPKISRFIASNQELLFLAAIAWGFGIAALFEKAGFSIEIGALFAGVALASSPYVQEISARLRPLRDFFIVLFFITLGKQLDISNLRSALVPAIVFSIIVIFFKPLIVMVVSGLLGYAKRVSFKAGVNLSQISEFSIILVTISITQHIIDPKIGSVITLVAIITIATSTYMMLYDDHLFKYFDRIRFKVFEKETNFREKKTNKSYEHVIFGYHHGGHEFIKTFKEIHKKFLVIDYDPDVIDILERQRVNYLYGDASDLELLKEADVDKAKMVISTIKDHRINTFLMKYLMEVNPDVIMICNASNVEHATELYELGASYVMIPHHIGTERTSSMIKKIGDDREEYEKRRARHLSALEHHLQEAEA